MLYCLFRMTINFPPVPLQTMDDVNVAFSVCSLVMVSILLLVSLFTGLKHFDFDAWSRREKVINFGKIFFTFVLCGLLLRFLIFALQEAFNFTLLSERQLPSNKILGIPICEEETIETRNEFCDEKSSLVRTLFAWIMAFGLGYYLVCRAAPLHEDASFTSTTKLGALAGRDQLAVDRDVTSTHADPSSMDAEGDEDDDEEESSSSGRDDDDGVPDRKEKVVDVEAAKSSNPIAVPPANPDNDGRGSHRRVDSSGKVDDDVPDGKKKMDPPPVNTGRDKRLSYHQVEV